MIINFYVFGLFESICVKLEILLWFLVQKHIPVRKRAYIYLVANSGKWHAYLSSLLFIEHVENYTFEK